MESSRKLYPKINNYLNRNYIETQLQNRYRNNEIETYSMPAEDLKHIMTIDEYFYRLISENTPNTQGTPLNIYLNEISRELLRQPLLLLSLPIYKIEHNKLKKYLPNYDYIINKINQIQYEVNSIFKRFIISPNNINSEELKKMVLFFSYTIPYANEKMIKAQDQVVKYILNYPKDTKYNYYTTTFLVKFLGYKKIQEEKLTDTQIIIGKLKPNTYGESNDNYAIISKESIQNVLMTNNTLEDKFGNINIYSTNNLKNYNYPNSTIKCREILGVVHTIYHEIRHQIQKNHSKSKILDDLSYYYAAYEIINGQNEYDYKTNYKCYEIEKDANYKAWEDVEKLIKTYMPNQNIKLLMKNILSHKLTEELEQITGIRKSQNNQSYISNSLLNSYLDEKFKNHPSLITNKYSQFLNFYNSNGIPKRIIELLNQPLIYNYKEFYFGQVIYRYQFFGYNITTKDIEKLSTKELQTTINNIKILLNINQEKLNKICDRVKLYNERSQEVLGNLVNYYNFAVYLSNVINSILSFHPNLINILSIRNSIDSINANIDMINNNRLVIKLINNTNKIGRVGRR